MAVLRHESKKHRRRRVHAAARDQALLRLLKLRNLLLTDADRRVTVAAVLVTLVPPLCVLDELLGVLEPVGGRLNDWSRQSIAYLGSPLPLCIVDAVRAAAWENTSLASILSKGRCTVAVA